VRWKNIITIDPLEVQRNICEMGGYYGRSSGGR
jgi:hypothetical protein